MIWETYLEHEWLHHISETNWLKDWYNPSFRVFKFTGDVISIQLLLQGARLVGVLCKNISDSDSVTYLIARSRVCSAPVLNVMVAPN